MQTPESHRRLMAALFFLAIIAPVALADQPKESRYDISPLAGGSDGEAWVATNLAQGIGVRFRDTGIAVSPLRPRPTAWLLSLELDELGTERGMYAVPPGLPSVTGDTIVFERTGCDESYRNLPGGLEHTLTIQAAADEFAERLVLVLRAFGTTRALANGSGTGALLIDRGSEAALRYDVLSARDGAGRMLAVSLEIDDSPEPGASALSLGVDVAKDTFPVTIKARIAAPTTLLPVATNEAYARYGWAAAIDGDTMVVTTPYDDEMGASSGAAIVYERDEGGANSWGQTAKLVPADTGTDYFGQCVTISGDTIVVGAPEDDDCGEDCGAAYVFERDSGAPGGWIQTTKLLADDGAEGRFFGTSVSVDTGAIVVGAPGPFYGGPEYGRTYVFEREQGSGAWEQVVTLIAHDAASGDRFGSSVGVSGGTLVVGAPDAYPVQQYDGAVYVFRRIAGEPPAWVEATQLYVPDGQIRLGYTVAIDGPVIAAHAIDSQYGRAYVFESDLGGNWAQTAELVPTDGELYQDFGYALSICGTTLAVGAPKGYVQCPQPGAAHIFERDQGGPGAWGHVARLTASDGITNDGFAVSVALSGDTVVAGALDDDDGGTDSGSAYLFQRDHGGPDAWGELIKKIPPPSPSARFRYMGPAAAIGTTAFVGAWGDDDAGRETGSVLIFDRNQGAPGAWGLVTRLLADDAEPVNRFGYSVASGGSTAIVCSPSTVSVYLAANIGSAYVLENDQGVWLQTAMIMADDGHEGDGFCNSVATDGNTTVVNATEAVYIFERDQGGPNAWGQVMKIPLADGAFDVTVSSDTVAIGNPCDDDLGTNAGAVLVFERDQGGPGSWGQACKILAADGEAGDSFGSAVVLTGDVLAVGASGDDDNGNNSGSAYVLGRDVGGPGAWGQVAKLIASDGAPIDTFGAPLAMRDNTIAVGAPRHDGGGENVGATYVFMGSPSESTAWREVDKLQAPDTLGVEYFGSSVAIGVSDIIVGAELTDAVGERSGAAYAFDLAHVGMLFADGFESNDTSKWSACLP